MRIFGITGWKDSGKTTLLSALVEEFVRRGHSISTIKHAHHEFDVDQPGRDSYKHRAAGAREVLVSSARRWALMHETGDGCEPGLDELLAKLQYVDLVLVEGFKQQAHAKIQVIAPGVADNFSLKENAGLLAFACANPAEAPEFARASNKPIFSRDDIIDVADFIFEHAQTWP